MAKVNVFTEQTTKMHDFTICAYRNWELIMIHVSVLGIEIENSLQSHQMPLWNCNQTNRCFTFMRLKGVYVCAFDFQDGIQLNADFWIHVITVVVICGFHSFISTNGFYFRLAFCLLMRFILQWCAILKHFLNSEHTTFINHPKGYETVICSAGLP